MGKILPMLYLIAGSSVVSNNSCEGLEPCDHEEGGTRIAFHLYDAVKKGATKILVRTVDTDILVILIGLLSNLPPDTQIWIALGTGKNFKYNSINAIHPSLGTEKSKALPFFHAFTGSDTTSQFHGKGKKSAWDARKAYEDITRTFTCIAEQPFQPLTIESELFEKLERFTCVLYDKSSTVTNVNELRQEMFSRQSKMIENIPPTQVNLFL